MSYLECSIIALYSRKFGGLSSISITLKLGRFFLSLNGNQHTLHTHNDIVDLDIINSFFLICWYSSQSAKPPNFLAMLLCMVFRVKYKGSRTDRCLEGGVQLSEEGAVTSHGKDPLLCHGGLYIIILQNNILLQCLDSNIVLSIPNSLGQQNLHTCCKRKHHVHVKHIHVPTAD